MERLTYRSQLGNAVSYGACEDVKCKVRDCDKCKVGVAICRLCDYEDAGLEPAEYKKYADAIKKLDIEHMHDLLQAEKDGRLVVLPCKPWDKVYQTDGLNIYESKVERIIFEADNIAFSEDAIGRSIFLTREKAEAALKKMENAES